MLENALFDFLMWYIILKIAGLKFTKTFNVDAFWDKDERINFGVRGQGHSMTKGPVHLSVINWQVV